MVIYGDVSATNDNKTFSQRKICISYLLVKGNVTSPWTRLRTSGHIMAVKALNAAERRSTQGRLHSLHLRPHGALTIVYSHA